MFTQLENKFNKIENAVIIFNRFKSFQVIITCTIKVIN